MSRTSSTATLSLFLACLLTGTSARGASPLPTVYKCVTASGAVEFTDEKRKGCKRLEAFRPNKLSFNQVRHAVEDKLTDPESARYKTLRHVQHSGAVCGRVNSKNRMGGYDGFGKFFVRPAAPAPEAHIEAQFGFGPATTGIARSRTPPKTHKPASAL